MLTFRDRVGPAWKEQIFYTDTCIQTDHSTDKANKSAQSQSKCLARRSKDEGDGWSGAEVHRWDKHTHTHWFLGVLWALHINIVHSPTSYLWTINYYKYMHNPNPWPTFNAITHILNSKYPLTQSSPIIRIGFPFNVSSTAPEDFRYCGCCGLFQTYP